MAPETWNTNSSAAEVVSIRSSRLIKLISLALMSATVRSGPLAVHVAARVRPHHPIYGFRLAFWCRRARKCTTFVHQDRQRVENCSKFTKCSSLAWFYEQTLYGDFFVNRVFQCMSFPPPFPVRNATPSPGPSEGVAVSIPSFFLLSQSPGPV